MESATVSAPAQDNPAEPRAPRRSEPSNRGRGGQSNDRRRRGGFGGPPGGSAPGHGRGRGQGRREGDVRTANFTQEPHTQHQMLPTNELPAAPVVPPAAVQTGDAAEAEEDVEAEVCFICASPVVHNSVAPCNHRTCHICALRMRALYKNKACAHCRTETEFVVFTDDPEKRFENFTEDDFKQVDKNLGIKYEKQEIFEDTILLLRYNCPDPTCDVACYGWPQLHRHVKGTHHKVMCDLCTKNKKVFTHEHELFTQSSLKKHQTKGDDNPGAIDQSGFKGHPECGFCQIRFYDSDDLFAHCRDRHERCHICDRTRPPGHQQQYFLDYNSLETHFGKEHFLCPDKECLEKKFVVFGSEMDLKAHQLEQHPHGLSKDARRDARRVDMSGFDYRQSHQEEQRRQPRREGRGGGRGRDPNAEPLPVSSAQPMPRDQLAYQRSLAIQSAQSITSRTFGGQLTSNDAVAARPPPNTQEPPTITGPARSSATTHPSSAPSLPNIATLDIGPTQPTIGSASTPEERARALRHSAVTERAGNLLAHSPEKLNSFRNRISEYRRSVISAANLVEAFFVLFDCPIQELGSLVKELAELFENSTKRTDLLSAWNDWRAVNEDYPDLPGAPAGPDGANSSGGKRILKLKSSTAKSSAAASSQQRSWATLSSGGRSTGGGRGAMIPEAFPGLPASAPIRSKTADWGPGSVAVSAGAPRITRPASGAVGTRPSVNNVNAFPSLPAAQKPSMNISRPGYFGNPYRRDGSGTSTPVNVWGSGGLVSPPVEAADDYDGSGPKVGKGKGKKKQTLIHWG